MRLENKRYMITKEDVIIILTFFVILYFVMFASFHYGFKRGMEEGKDSIIWPARVALSKCQNGSTCYVKSIGAYISPMKPITLTLIKEESNGK